MITTVARIQAPVPVACNDAMTSAKDDSSVLSREVSDPIVGGLSMVVCQRPRDGRSAVEGGRLSSAAQEAVGAWEGLCLLMGPERNDAPPLTSCSAASTSVHVEEAGASVPEMWWMLHVGSRRCGVTAVRLVPRHGRPPDG